MLAAGAIDDVIAWAVLAVVLASFRGEPRIAFLAVGGGALFVLRVLRPLLRPLAARAERSGQISAGKLVSVLMLPCFFVYSGLNTRIGLVATPAL